MNFFILITKENGVIRYIPENLLEMNFTHTYFIYGVRNNNPLKNRELYNSSTYTWYDI